MYGFCFIYIYKCFMITLFMVKCPWKINLKEASHISIPPKSIPNRVPNFVISGLIFLTAYKSVQIQEPFIFLLYAVNLLFCILVGLIIASTVASAANIPDFIALWVPLILGTLTMPALHPKNIPPGKSRLAQD